METRLCTKNTKEALHQQELLRLLAPHKHPTKVETMFPTKQHSRQSHEIKKTTCSIFLAPRNTSPRRAWGLLHGFPTLSAPGIPRYFQKGKWIIATAEVMGLLRFFLGFPEVFKIVTFLNFLPWNLFGINKKHEDIHFDPAAMVEIPSCCLLTSWLMAFLLTKQLCGVNFANASKGN